ncbi:hypothetical protein AYI68_g87 [Smittium mucronatum]|uniref:CCHC-type domain-containing protein n=1 Tax=Smittium mucronatum TaxID=133383 RepID=A0A1R0H977_9FUNG|nr:hypothetical protein AYI68_g87 [Smittium mucronatum]
MSRETPKQTPTPRPFKPTAGTSNPTITPVYQEPGPEPGTKPVNTPEPEPVPNSQITPLLVAKSTLIPESTLKLPDAVRFDGSPTNFQAFMSSMSFTFGHVQKSIFRQDNSSNFTRQPPRSYPANPYVPTAAQTGTGNSEGITMEIYAITSKFRVPLTHQEKQRRRELGLCLYCGRPGHLAEICSLNSSSGKCRSQ